MKKRINNFTLAFIALAIAISNTSCTLKNPSLSSSGADPVDVALSNAIRADKKITAKQNSRHLVLPKSINKALMPALPGQMSSQPGSPNTAITSNMDQRFDIAVNNVPAKDFFMGLVKGTKYNMTVNPQVTGMITLDLKNVSIPEVMDTARDVYGYEYQSTAYGYQVYPRQLETRIFSVNYLDINRNGNSQTSIQSAGITRSSTSNAATGATTESAKSAGSTVETISKTDFWKELKDNLDITVGDKNGHSVVINPESGMVIVRAYPDELRSVAKYLDGIQNHMGREVLIEAQIIEVELDAEYQSGINWKLLSFNQGTDFTAPAAAGSAPNLQVPNNINPELNNIFIFSPSSGGAFSSFIKLLSSQGIVHVLSTPRISTTNNQKALIKVGQDKFFVTNVTSNTTTGTSSSTSQNVELTPFFSGIALDVTPQIDEDNGVTLHIHPVISKVTQDRQTFTVNGQLEDLPLAKSDVRESDSVVSAKSGQIIIIGGLMSKSSNEYDASTPGTEKFKYLRGLFRSTDKDAVKSELVILLKPQVVDSSGKVWSRNLQDSAKAFNGLKGDFSYQLDIDKNNQPCDPNKSHNCNNN